MRHILRCYDVDNSLNIFEMIIGKYIYFGKGVKRAQGM